jgi:hypothetical protein
MHREETHRTSAPVSAIPARPVGKPAEMSARVLDTRMAPCCKCLRLSQKNGSNETCNSPGLLMPACHVPVLWITASLLSKIAKW